MEKDKFFENIDEAIEDALGEIEEEMQEYEVVEVEGDDGIVYEFAITDYFEYEDRTFAVLNLVEDEEVQEAYMIYEAIVDEENKEITLEELDEESEDVLSNLYFEEILKEELGIEDEEEEEIEE